MIEGLKKTGAVPAARVVCDMKCGREEVVPCFYKGRAKPMIGEPDQGQIHKKMISMGWSLVKGVLRCPACEAKRKAAQAGETAQAAQAVPADIAPSKKQRIQIISMLAEVYDLDAGMYAGGETDETVAGALEIAPGYVEQVRAAEFGPAGGNEDIKELRADLEAFKGDAAEALEALARLNRDLRARIERARDLADRLGRIEKAVGARVIKRGAP
ncbi:hypothetical protein [Yoonia sp.]|uniref:hypothetical protein n=1 Tax=Yoonia sp. TaxID=2212373 RepID=UPI0025E92D76|nr:hypothetical protein [Yoonia sp.]